MCHFVMFTHCSHFDVGRLFESSAILRVDVRVATNLEKLEYSGISLNMETQGILRDVHFYQ